MTRIYLEPIGVVSESSFTRDGPKIRDVSKVDAVITIHDRFVGGLKGLAQERYLDIIFWLHHVGEDERRQLICSSGRRRYRGQGVFATRRPQRPNPIGVTRVRLLAVSGSHLHVRGLDAYPGTPIIDIKPGIGRLRSGARAGW